MVFQFRPEMPCFCVDVSAFFTHKIFTCYLSLKYIYLALLLGLLCDFFFFLPFLNNLPSSSVVSGSGYLAGRDQI